MIPVFSSHMYLVATILDMDSADTEYSIFVESSIGQHCRQGLVLNMVLVALKKVLNKCEINEYMNK